MLKLSCGEYEQLEFNSARKSIYTITNLLSSRVTKLKNEHARYLSKVKHIITEEYNGTNEEEVR